MGKMEATGESIEPLSMTELQAISQQRQQPSEVLPTWVPLILTIAQDKRHDLAAATLRLWRAKLKPFADADVQEALLSGAWEFFPSVDQVIDRLERILAARAQESVNREWRKWKAEQKRAEQEGLLATEEGIAEMRAALRKLAGKDRTV